MVVVMPGFSMIIPVLPFYVKSLGASRAAITLAGFAVNLLAINSKETREVEEVHLFES